MKNKEAINLIIEITKQNLKKYETMKNLKNSKCIISEALQDNLSLSLYCDDYLGKNIIYKTIINMNVNK
tara:strand:- start:111 stop:317 length:207 start_codon:yes stop_codon:yes gene_type:complete